MSKPLWNERYRDPSLVIPELIRSAMGGLYSELGDYHNGKLRALVVAVDPDGGKLQNLTCTGHSTQKIYDADNNLAVEYNVPASQGPANPKLSVKARIMTWPPQVIDDESLPVFWPQNPEAQNPSPGEEVYVWFEDSEKLHGLWESKVTSNVESSTPTVNFLNSATAAAASAKKSALYPDTEVPPGSTPTQALNYRATRWTRLFLK